MSLGTLRHRLLVMNPDGFHMRPAADFAQRAQAFLSDIRVAKVGGAGVNGKSLLQLMSLVAEKGSELTLEVSGPDAEQALLALVELLAPHAIVDANRPLPHKG